ncbi:oxysterol-binding protein-related protein 6-like isoform X1 [Pecten maximus]|uniref:oxysterol-binding protein-related protein 6-like isoform X1 n=1 Tax=Pecten maximus TaxID=6579 RepID=UPI001458DF95|nr:oxysterol-binding protein-related protein 6-like isoform X1 [Pecten maximus]XP_033728022.1 oxysterol-binding protein-related protein 6-like isoform X1 [Pecten maximus]XP_033728023.1 oxysterol-binding protein-related protein 6-like isoform X1 [Pecten maximus]
MSGENPGGRNPAPENSPVVVRKKLSTAEEKRKHFRHSDSDSESDNSDDEISLANSQMETSSKKDLEKTQSSNKSTPAKGRKRRKQRHDWEIVEGLRDGHRCEEKPEKYQGFMLKRRRWPMKGWHKRFFNLDKGFLLYSKSPLDSWELARSVSAMQKCKYHGVIDVGLSVVAFKKHQHRIYIDAEDIVYHIKVKDNRLFDEWLNRLRHHRLYRQHELAYGTKDSPRLTEITSPTEELPPLTASLNFPGKAREQKLSSEVIRQSSFKGRESSQSRVATWLLDTAGFEHCNKELHDTRKLLNDLREDLEQIRNLPLSMDSNTVMEVAELESPDARKKLKGLALRSSKKKDKKIEACNNHHDNESGNHLQINSDNIRTSSSNPNLLQYETEKLRPRSVPDYQTVSNHEQRIKELKLREDFVIKSDTVYSSLMSLFHMMGTERDRLKSAIDLDNGMMTAGSANTLLLRQNLTEAHRTIAEMKARLMRINFESSLEETKTTTTPASPLLSPLEREPRSHGLSQSLSAESCSMSEYYDAEEYKESGSESSSEPSDDEEISSEISEENDTDYNAAISVSEDQLSETFQTGHRSKLPVPKPDSGDVSLWNLLYKNLGKDLTKISMPVTLNEPLSMLQRLCEELEYSELVDKAVEIDDPYERMLYIAAFTMSSYASSGYRAGHKPFNPLLGETYECIREDKGWKFMAEQVSHHPPISACYCESKNFTFWQDVRIKTKFWGKSMEIQPLGIVNLFLPKFKDHYKWNKVTTCVHNLLGGQRWVDQYGEMQIRNGDIVCKLTFTKANHWSGKRHEVYGQILNPEGKVIHNLFGKWNEALYCGHAPSTRCIWRPGAMPEDFELYYGFTRFAIELNEPESELEKVLPPTDSRFRPDQRLLEEGRIADAEKEKSRVEQMQREKRKKQNASKTETLPKWFRKYTVSGKDYYEYAGRYWDTRKDSGFSKISFPQLW